MENRNYVELIPAVAAGMCVISVILGIFTSIYYSHKNTSVESKIQRIKKELVYNECFNSVTIVKDPITQQPRLYKQLNEVISIKFIGLKGKIGIAREKVDYFCAKGNLNYRTLVYFDELNMHQTNTAQRFNTIKELKHKPFNELKFHQ